MISKLVLNDLSIDNQFTNNIDFFNNLKIIMKMFNILDKKNIKLKKNENLYSLTIDNKKNIHSILKERSDESTRFKSFLSSSLFSEPYFIKRETYNRYFCKGNDVTNSALSEAFNEDENTISFLNSNYSDDILFVKNELDSEKNIINFTDCNKLIEFLYGKQILDVYEFCELYFKDTKLSFEKIDINEEFKNLSPSDIMIYVNSFKNFADKSWNEILKDNGLDYKNYHLTLNGYGRLYKFRANRKMRCIGYRNSDIFYLIKLDPDHKLSD